MSKTGVISIDDLTEVAHSLGYLKRAGEQRDGITLSVTPEDIREIHQYCAANDPNGEFSFGAWRTVMAEMASGRADAKTYESVHKAPDHVWEQIQREEEMSRQERIEKEEEKKRDNEYKQERAKAARKSYNQYREECQIGSPRWDEERKKKQREAQLREQQLETQQLKLRKKRELLQSQRDQEAREREADDRERRQIQERINAKRVNVPSA